jgi:hypothetical protein
MAKMIASLNAGIIPINLNLNEALKDMSPDAARVCKRKFRKLKRKAMKKLSHVKFVKHRQDLAKRNVYNQIEREAFQILKGAGTVSD